MKGDINYKLEKETRVPMSMSDADVRCQSDRQEYGKYGIYRILHDVHRSTERQKNVSAKFSHFSKLSA